MVAAWHRPETPGCWLTVAVEKIQLDRHPLRVLNEKLAQFEVRDFAALERDVHAFKAGNKRIDAIAAEGDVIDRAGTAADMTFTVTRVIATLEFRIADMYHRAIFEVKPMSWETEVRAWTDFEFKYVSIKVAGYFQV